MTPAAGRAFAALALLLALAGCTPGGPRPLAEDGVLDLRTRSFATLGAVRLEGEWRYAPRALLPPAAVTDTQPRRVADLPTIWGREAGGADVPPGAGFATYVLDVRLPPDTGPLGVRVLTLSSAFRLWADGTLVASAGRVGRGPGTSEPEYAPRTTRLPADDDGRLRLVLQVSNFQHAKGGPWEPLWIGPLDELRREREGRIGLAMFLTGAFWIIGLYHLLLWAARRPDRSSLLFALACFAIGVRNLTVDEVYLASVSDLSFETLVRLEYGSMLAIFGFAWAFVREIFPREQPRRVVAAFAGASLVGIVLVAVLPVPLFTRALPVMQAMFVVAAVVAPTLLVRSLLRRREGAGLFLVGVVAIALASLHDILISVYHSLPTIDVFGGRIYLQPVGLIVFVLCQATVLAFRSSHTLTQLELRTKELAVARDTLDRHARELEARVADRTTELREANEELARLAQIDGLTGLGNRRHFDEKLATEWADHQRRGAPLSLVMIDVDHFKRFNDRYGHTEGDEALRDVARALDEAVRRPRDLVARYGGEEMVALLTDTDAEGAANVGEALRAAVEALGREHVDTERGVLTISVGVATRVPAGEGNPTTLVEDADAALYRAKHAGRNRVERAA
jgi:diguanylate cyclase (GGDEF)-like protein